MAKKKEELSDGDFIDQMLKSNPQDHFNFIEERYYRISSGSLLLDYKLEGGFTAGLHRFVGRNEGGKTREALEVARNFMRQLKKSKVIFFNAEGRLTKKIKELSGLDFVYQGSDWTNDNIMVVDTNIYEFCANVITHYINKDTDEYYLFIVDSIDGLIPKVDLDKGYGEASKVAGGATIASHLMKKISIPMAKKGHMGIFMSQVRANQIKLDTYSPPPTDGQISGTGGNALLHYANFILEFLPWRQSKLILQDEGGKFNPNKPDQNPAIGHYATVEPKKSGNDITYGRIEYPIRHNVSGKSAIWVEREIVEILMGWGFLERGGSWYSFSFEGEEDLPESIQSIDNTKYQGLASVYRLIEDNPKLSEDLFCFCLNTIT